MLQLSDGTISANRESLASFSPVFERMFNGEFKEKKSSIIPLPTDKLNTFKQLFGIIYKGGCEVESLDDIDPLMEVVERYDFNKVPFLQMCGQAILSQINSSNYLTLLPKYVSVMSEESHKEAAEKIVQYTNYDFTKYDGTKCLPENVLLFLLKRSDLTSHEVDIFRFLVQWYDYQTNKLEISLELVPQLFECVRYPLIIPQILSSEVAKCGLVSKYTLSKAFEYLYGSSKPIGQHDNKMLVSFNKCQRQPNSLMPQWDTKQGVDISYPALNKCKVCFEYGKLERKSIMKSLPLGNGIYSFCLESFIQCKWKGDADSVLDVPPYYLKSSLNIAIVSKNGEILFNNALLNGNTVTVYAHDEYLFLKFLENDEIKSTITTHGDGPYSLLICLGKDHIQHTKFVGFKLNIYT